MNCLLSISVLCGLVGKVVGDVSVVVGNIGEHATLNIFVSDSHNGTSHATPSECPAEQPPTPNGNPTYFPSPEFTASPSSWPVYPPTSESDRWQNSTYLTLGYSPVDVTVGPDDTVYWSSYYDGTGTSNTNQSCIFSKDINNNERQVICSDDTSYAYYRIQMGVNNTLYATTNEGLQKISTSDGSLLATIDNLGKYVYFVDTVGDIYLGGDYSILKIDTSNIVTTLYEGNATYAIAGDENGNLYCVLGYEAQTLIRLNTLTSDVTVLSVLPEVLRYQFPAYVWDIAYHNGNIYMQYTGETLWMNEDPFSIVGNRLGPLKQFNIDSATLTTIGNDYVAPNVGNPFAKGFETWHGVFAPRIAISSHGVIYETSAFTNEIIKLVE